MKDLLDANEMLDLLDENEQRALDSITQGPDEGQ